MAEPIREIAVTVEVDTNKNTYKKRLTWQEGETREEFDRRVVETISATINELTELT